jgi:molybdate transport system ATP-binding protein
VNGLALAFAGRRGDFSLDVAFDVPSDGVTALFGPSGAGKTSILRGIAGLARYAGSCRLGEEVWQDENVFVAPHRRPVGYVFQDASLFPHLSVRQNLTFGLKRTRGAPVIGFDDAVSLVGAGPLLDRDSMTLSGGERQRVALGRALLAQPKVLLLDEPLSALDRAAKDEILPYFEALGRAVALPVLLVTHDIAEVERLADRMVYVEQGQVVALGPLNDMLTGGAAPLRRARDAAAVLAGRVVGYDAADGLSEIAAGSARFLVAGRAGQAGQSVRLRIAARDVSLARQRPSASSILNVFETAIVAIEPLGEAEALVTLRLGGETMLARLTRRSVRTLGLAPGEIVFAQVKGVSLLAGG